MLGLVTVGVAMLVRLMMLSSIGAGGRSLIDTDPGRVLARVGPGMAEIWGPVLPLYLQWFPWWPLTLLIVLTALLLPASRRRLVATWYWMPLVAAPLAFLVVFHTVVPLDVRDYRIRFAYFAVPPLTILVGVVGHALGEAVAGSRVRVGGVGRWLGAVLVTALLVSQVPATARVLTEDDTVDLAAAGQLLADRVPEGAVVVFDGPGLTGRWRQPFFGQRRFLDADTTVVNQLELARGQLRPVSGGGPIWLLLLDARCVSSVSCDLQPADWDGQVDGYRPVARLPYLTLYEPMAGQQGRRGLLRTMRALVRAYGAPRAFANAVVAARILVRRGSRREAARPPGAGVPPAPRAAGADVSSAGEGSCAGLRPRGGERTDGTTVSGRRGGRTRA